MWTLTYSVEGKRRVEYVPEDLVPLVRALADEGRAYREAAQEVLTINARLLSLWRRQKRASKTGGKRGE